MLPLPPPQAAFSSRHIGLNDADIDAMLDSVGVSSLTELLDTVIPENIRRQSEMALQPALSEHEILVELKEVATKNQIKTSLIGMGYYNCHTPPVIQRNILENPAWYTAYTPYQPAGDIARAARSHFEFSDKGYGSDRNGSCQWITA